MMGVINLLLQHNNPSQALRPSVVTGNGGSLRSSLGIALRNVRRMREGSTDISRSAPQDYS